MASGGDRSNRSGGRLFALSHGAAVGIPRHTSDVQCLGTTSATRSATEKVVLDRRMDYLWDCRVERYAAVAVCLGETTVPRCAANTRFGEH